MITESSGQGLGGGGDGDDRGVGTIYRGCRPGSGQERTGTWKRTALRERVGDGTGKNQKRKGDTESKGLRDLVEVTGRYTSGVRRKVWPLSPSIWTLRSSNSDGGGSVQSRGEHYNENWKCP